MIAKEFKDYNKEVQYIKINIIKLKNKFGMKLHGNDPVIVQSVSKNGPAWKAGIQSEDILMKINNTSVENFALKDVKDLLKSHHSVELYIQRKCSSKFYVSHFGDEFNQQQQLEDIRYKLLQNMIDSHNNYARDLSRKHENELVAAKEVETQLQKQLEAAAEERSKLHKQFEEFGYELVIIPPNKTSSKIDISVTSANLTNEGILNKSNRNTNLLNTQEEYSPPITPYSINEGDEPHLRNKNRFEFNNSAEYHSYVEIDEIKITNNDDERINDMKSIKRKSIQIQKQLENFGYKILVISPNQTTLNEVIPLGLSELNIIDSPMVTNPKAIRPPVPLRRTNTQINHIPEEPSSTVQIPKVYPRKHFLYKEDNIPDLDEEKMNNPPTQPNNSLNQKDQASNMSTEPSIKTGLESKVSKEKGKQIQHLIKLFEK